jgi:TatD DNase family protein
MRIAFPKIIDSHAHLNLPEFNEDREKVLDQTLDSGTWVINVGTNFETSRQAIEIAQRYSQGVYASVGIHPIYVEDETYSQKCMLDLIQNNENVVAVGEIGLDYFHIKDKRGKIKNSNSSSEISRSGKSLEEKQQDLLLKQLNLARISGLPVIFHCRHYKNYDAHYDLLKTLEKFATLYKDFVLRGVVHCYTGDAQLAKIYLKLGLYLGFTGIITFSDNYDKIIEETPLERILIETDSPYLSPEPKRGKRNIPENVKFVAEKIAKLKKMKISKIKKKTLGNAQKLFSFNGNHLF